MDDDNDDDGGGNGYLIRCRYLTRPIGSLVIRQK